MKTYLFHSTVRILIASSITIITVSAGIAQKTGSAAPDFAVLDMRGIQRTLKDFQDQVLIINFWATYCPPCRQEKPSMEELYLQLKDQGLQIIAITNEKKRAIERYLKKNPVSFEVMRDYDGSAHKAYAVFSYPQTYLVDREGIVVHVFHGPQNWTDKAIVEGIDSLLLQE